MIHALAFVFGLLLLGEIFAAVSGLPVPGAALGLAALAAAIASSGGPSSEMGRLFDAVAPHVPLLFVPATVSVIARLDDIAQVWAYLAVAAIPGTALTLAVAGLAAQALLKGAARLAGAAT